MIVQNGIGGKTFKMHFYKKTRTLFIYECMVGASVMALFQGAFLAGYLNFLGINTEISAMIMQIPLLVTPIQLFSPLFFERKGRRLPIMKALLISMRSLLIVMGFVTMAVASVNVRIAIVTLILVAGYTMSSFADPSWVDYLANIVPARMRMKYISVRNPQAMFVGALVSLGMSFVLDHFRSVHNERMGFVLIFAVAAVLVAADINIILRLDEPAIRYQKSKLNLKHIFSYPLRDAKYLKFIIFSVIYNFSIQFANSYFTLYLVSDLKLAFWYITALSVLANLFRIISGRIWGKLSKSMNTSKIIVIGCLTLACTYLAWVFVTGSLVHIILPIVNITAAAGLTGTTMGIFAANIESAPKNNRTVYFAFNSCFTNVIGFLAATVGAFCNGLIKNVHFGIAGLNVGSMQVLFVIEGLLMLMTALYASTVLGKSLHAKPVK